MRIPSTAKAILAVVALMSLNAAAAHAQVGETYYIPLPSTQVKIWADAQTNLAENDILRVGIALTITAPDTIVYWDHWEDGFEFDIQDPASPGTGLGAEIWGDQDCANGYRPDIVGPCAGAADIFLAGDVLILTSDVPVPGDPGVRDPAQIRFDGGDKLFSTDLLAVTYASWPSSGIEAQLGDAIEVFPSEKWGSDFTSPVGTNLTGAPAAFEFVAVSIMARENGTQVAVDVDGTGGGAAVVYTLDEGESVLVQGVLVGATVAATPSSGIGTRAVQVDILTANNASTYEGRWFNLPSTNRWGSSYWAPAGTTVAGADTAAIVYVHNPGGATISVSQADLTGTVAFNVLAHATVARTLPLTSPISAAHFFTTGGTPPAFYAVSAIAINQTIFDWGYALIPEANLTPAAVVGWAPGSTDLNRDVSPIWLTVAKTTPGTTTIYVDEDGDPATGPNIDPNGNRYNVACVVSNLQSIRVFDDGPSTPNPPPAGSCSIPSGDNSQTGMRIYTLDGTKIVAAWGQDVSLAASGQPTELDMGTTVLPFSSLNAFKDGALLVDLNGNGGVDIGDTILYTTVVRNTGITPVTEIFVTDALDSGTAYVPGTFEVDGLPVADDAFPSQPAQPNAYPLDTDAPHTGGFVLVESPAASPPPVYALPLFPGASISMTYQVVVLPGANDPIVNTVQVRSDTETFVDTSTNPIPSALLTVTKTSNVPGDAIPGQTILYTMQVTNNSTTAAVTGVRLTDGLPVGTTYVAQSTSVTGPQQLYVADRFGTVTRSYANSNGPNTWADGADAGTVPDPWVEVEGGAAGPTGGDVQVQIAPGGGAAAPQSLFGGSTDSHPASRLLRLCRRRPDADAALQFRRRRCQPQ